MASGANDITLSVGMDTSDVMSAADNTSKKLENIFNRASGKKLSASTKSILQQLDALDTKMQTLRDKMSDIKVDNPKLTELQESLKASTDKVTNLKSKLAEIKNQEAPTQEYQKLKDKLAATEDEAKKVSSRLKDLLAKDAQHSTSKSRANIDGYQKKLAQLNQTYKETGTRMQEMEKNGTATSLPENLQEKYTKLSNELKTAEAEVKRLNIEIGNTPATVVDTESAQYQNLAEQLSSVINKVTIYRARLRETQDGAKLDVSGWQRLGHAIGQVAKFIAMVPIKTLIASVKILLPVLKSVASAAWNAAKNLARMCANAIKSGISKLGSSLFGLKSNLGSANDGFRIGLKTIMKYAFGVRSLFFLIRRLRTFLLEGLQGLGEAYAPFGQTIQSFKNALNELKGSFISAFAPIASTVIPILNTLMSAITAVLNKIAMLFAALRGQTSYLKANVVPATEAAGSAASGAADAAEKYKKTLAGFDDVEILQGPNSSSGGGGGGGGGGSSGDSWTAEELPIDSGIANFVSNLRALIENQDWEGLGQFLGEKINDAFALAKNFLTSEELITKITSIIDAVTSVFNSLVDAINWPLIGETLGAGINLITDVANQLLTKINWWKLGNSIAEGFNGLFNQTNFEAIGEFFSNKLNAIIELFDGFVTGFKWIENATELGKGFQKFLDNINWTDLAHGISVGIKGALNGFSTAVQQVDWKQLGTDLKNFIVGIDWAGIAAALTGALGSALGALGGFFIGLFEDAWAELVEWWEQVAFEDGQFTIAGLFRGIGQAFADIYNWIKTNVFDPFIDAFKRVFGIASPATEMELPGKYIAEGILKGISDKFSNITNWIKEHIFTPIKNGLADFKEKIQVGVELLKKGWETVGGWVKTFPGDVAQKSVELLKKGWETVGAWVMTSPGELAQKSVQLLKSGWETVGAWVMTSPGELAQKSVQLLKYGWETVGAWVMKYPGSVAQKSVQLLKSGWKTVGAWVAGYPGGNVNKGIGLIRNFGQRIWNVASWVLQYMGGNVNKEVGLKKDFGNRIYNVADWVKQYIGGTVQVGVSLFKSGWSSIKSFFGLASGGIVGANGGVKLFSGGGRISRLSAESWNNITKYARGTASAHGSMFIAGEAGPEIVGHVGGRTEVLNKSQIASAIYSAVLTAMTTISQTIGHFLANTIVDSTNLINDTINTLQNSFTMPIPVIVTGEVAIPEIAAGYIVPSMAQLSAVQRSNELLASAIDSLNRTNSDKLTNEELERIIERVIKRTMNIQFYIGDEQIARHANAGNNKLALRYNKG